MPTAAMRYEVPRPPGGLGSVALAVLVHSLLVILLVFGVRWQSQPPTVIQAELWSALPQVAAPPPPTPAPPPEPNIPKHTPETEEPAPVKPDIAIKIEKPKKKEPPKIEPPKPLVKIEPVKPPLKVEIKPPKAPPKPEVKVPPKPSQSVAELMAQAGAPNKGPTTPTGGTSAGDAGYVDLIRAKIRSNIRFPLPPDLVGNPEAQFVIEQLPTGEVVSVNKIKSSGLPAFDAAVERAILASSPLPKRKVGTPDRTLDLRFRPLDRPEN